MFVKMKTIRHRKNMYNFEIKEEISTKIGNDNLEAKDYVMQKF